MKLSIPEIIINLEGLTSVCTCGAELPRGREFTKHRNICPNAIAEREEAQRMADEEDRMPANEN